jgi:hypothetical protein
MDAQIRFLRRICHVRGMSAEPSTTELPISYIGGSNGPHSPARAAGARHRRGAATGRRVVDLQRTNFRPPARRHPRHPRQPIVAAPRSSRRRLRRPRAGAGPELKMPSNFCLIPRSVVIQVPVISNQRHPAAGASAGPGARRWHAHPRWGREGRTVGLPPMSAPKKVGSELTSSASGPSRQRPGHIIWRGRRLRCGPLRH